MFSSLVELECLEVISTAVVNKVSSPKVIRNHFSNLTSMQHTGIGKLNQPPTCSEHIQLCKGSIYIYIYMYECLHHPKFSMEPEKKKREDSSKGNLSVSGSMLGFRSVCRSTFIQMISLRYLSELERFTFILDFSEISCSGAKVTLLVTIIHKVYGGLSKLCIRIYSAKSYPKIRMGKTPYMYSLSFQGGISSMIF